MNIFTPNYLKDGLDKHVKNGIFWYLIVATIFSAIATLLLLNYPSLTPADPDLMLRSISEKIIKIILILTCALGTCLYVDWRWNGNLVKGIINNQMAPAVFGSAIFLGVIILGCYL